MASGGCVSVSHLSTPYSTSRSTFSIKNILNLQEDKNEDHQKFPSGSKQADTYLSSSFPLIPRATRSHFLHAPTCYSDFKINFSRVHNLRPVAQMNQFPFPSYGSSFGEKLLQKRRRIPLRKKKQRPLFSTSQIQTMENEFTKCQYVTESRRAELAGDLNLTETQVKTWFQNRRTKWKKERKETSEPPSKRVQSYNEEAIRHSIAEGDLIHYSEQYHLYPVVWNVPNLSNFPCQKSLFRW